MPNRCHHQLRSPFRVQEQHRDGACHTRHGFNSPRALAYKVATTECPKPITSPYGPFAMSRRCATSRDTLHTNIPRYARGSLFKSTSTALQWSHPASQVVFVLLLQFWMGLQAIKSADRAQARWLFQRILTFLEYPFGRSPTMSRSGGTLVAELDR